MVLNDAKRADSFRWPEARGRSYWLGNGVLALTGVLLVSHLAAGNRRAEIELSKLREETAGLAQLQSDVARARAESSDPLELDRLRREHDEIVNLRDRLARLGNRAVTLELLERARRTERNKTARAPSGSSLFTGNRGRSSPMNTFASVVWAGTRGEVETLADAISFDPAGRKTADELFARLPESVHREYGGVENVCATLLAASIPLGLADAQVMHEENLPNGDRQVTLKLMRENGSAHERTFRFRITGSEAWQLVVPDEVVARFSEALRPQGAPMMR